MVQIPPTLLHAENVGYAAAGNQILENINLSVCSGEIVTLIGPNGSGKTTLMRALLGLIKVQGTIARHPALKVGYVPQQLPRDTSLPVSVEDFLMLFAPRAAALAALERTGVARLRRAQLSHLSGGEMARVQLARAISVRPNLLVLDEPTASVDLTGERALYQLIGEIRDELDCGVLLVSHDLHMVMAQSCRVICLNHHICCQGAPAEVMQNPAFRALFRTFADGGIAPYLHRHNGSGNALDGGQGSGTNV